MPSRIQVHQGTTAPPRLSPISVNEVVAALQRKITATHLESPTIISPKISPKNSRRPSFSMDNLLHHKKDKKHDEPKDRDSRDLKRMSLHLRSSNKSKDRKSAASPKAGPVKVAHFENITESPPVVLFGSASSSSGALISGRLKLVIDDPTGELRLEKFTMSFKTHITTKKPIGKDCRDCTERVDELKSWAFLSEPKTFFKDRDNQFPYSYLVPGNLPATTQSQLATISYALYVTAVTSHGEKIEYSQPVSILRAIHPGPEKASIRIFPPTNLTGRVQLPPIVHPIGTFPITMSLSGVVEKKAESQTRWRLRKLSWRIEEHSKVISTPCAKHAHKVSEGKSILHSETRVLGNDEIKGGWKSDFDTVGGEINMEFEASLAARSNHRATCDVDASSSGIEVKHNLVLELIVAEEFCPNKNTQLITPTGAARVLRMQFALIVTQRAGMGISWDEEMPPVYQDVPDSPPGYGSSDKNDGAWGGAVIEDYHGPPLEYEDLEAMTDGPSHIPADAPPSYRNAGLPMRQRPFFNSRTSSGEGPSTRPDERNRITGFTNDELDADIVQPSWRDREAPADESAGPVEETEEGQTSGAALRQ